MKNVFVYCEVTEEKTIADVSLELLSKGRKLAERLGVQLEAIVLTDEAGSTLDRIQDFGVDTIHVAEHKELFPYRTLPHFRIVQNIFKKRLQK